MKQFLNKNILIDKSWANIFHDLRDDVSLIERMISKTSYKPDTENVFRVFELPLEDIKVVILGQDPYPNGNDATGIAFELNNYNDWLTPTKNTSLINILKELYFETTNNRDSIFTIRTKIKTSEFEIFKPNEIFQKWRNNGVFMLNTSLTCAENTPNSHEKIWSSFMWKIIIKIATNKNDVKWLLWGNEAKKFIPLIKISGNNQIHESVHPSKKEFINSGAFKQVIKNYCITK